MFQKLQAIEDRFKEIESLLREGEVIADRERYLPLAKEHASLIDTMRVYRDLKAVEEDIENNTELLEDADEELRELAGIELQTLQQKRDELEKELKTLFLLKDPRDDKNVILEVRAGTGGDEAALFVANLFRMYSKYAEHKRWKVEVMSSNPTGIGGFKEIIALISGKGVYSRLRYESGVHRVQRVPETEASGRIHTSAVTVAIMPEADEVEIDIAPNDLKIDVFRSSGPGGQSVNTTDSAVRITHIPTGIVVSCQDEKSQHKNKSKGLKILKARLLDLKEQEQHKEIADNRRLQIGTGDRSERIRTYNFPQTRITDHRIGLTLHKLNLIMEGDMDIIIDALIIHYQAEALKAENTKAAS
ncbi:MAG: peptide chain release factor 1 [Thermodesulfobacteriota bacterium]